MGEALDFKSRKNVSLSNAQSSDLPGYLKIKDVPRLHEEARPYRPQKKYNPEFNYGISFESPSYFELSHTLINEKTYKNPFLPYNEKSRQTFKKLIHQEGQPGHRKNLSHLQDFHIVSEEFNNTQKAVNGYLEDNSKTLNTRTPAGNFE